jgi:cytochrome P450 family 9
MHFRRKSKFLFGGTINTTVNTFYLNRIIGVFEFRRPFYMLRDPGLIKQLAIKDFDHFMDHRTIINPQLDPMFASSLISLNGHSWKEMRSSLSPIFTGSRMRQMFHCVSECGARMARALLKEAETRGPQTYEMKDIFTRFTNDVIASSAFGIEVNSFVDKDNEFYKLGGRVVNFRTFKSTLKFLGYMLAPAIMRVLKITFLDPEAISYFQKVLADNFETRETNNIVRNDLIHLLMQIRKGQSVEGQTADEGKLADAGFATVEESEIGKRTVQRQWTDVELMAQCFVFFLAGFETSSTLLTFAAYELAVNPDVQTKLHEEIMATHADLGGKTLTYEALQKMKYLDMVISEALRKWPPAPLTDRLCVKDYHLKCDDYDFTIEKGNFCWIPVYPLHHDAKYWPNPEKFDPERFSDDNKANINAGAYLPFGVGPRNCIGSRFALMESKAVFYYILLNFSLVVTTETQVPVKIAKGMAGLAAEKGVHLQMKPRKV